MNNIILLSEPDVTDVPDEPEESDVPDESDGFQSWNAVDVYFLQIWNNPYNALALCLKLNLLPLISRQESNGCS